jgi:hypothetical protein
VLVVSPPSYAVAVARWALVLASPGWAGWAMAEVVALMVGVGFIPGPIGRDSPYRLFDIEGLINRLVSLRPRYVD